MNSALPATNALAASYAERANSFAQQKAGFSNTSSTSEGSKTAVEASKLLSGNAIYYSPALKIDPQTQIVIYIQRDPGTGDVIRQYPSQEVVKAYKQTMQEKLDSTSVFAQSGNKDAKQSDLNGSKDNFGESTDQKTIDTASGFTTGTVPTTNITTSQPTPATFSPAPTGTLTSQAIAPIGSNSDELV